MNKIKKGTFKKGTKANPTGKGGQTSDSPPRNPTGKGGQKSGEISRNNPAYHSVLDEKSYYIQACRENVVKWCKYMKQAISGKREINKIQADLLKEGLRVSANFYKTHNEDDNTSELKQLNRILAKQNVELLDEICLLKNNIKKVDK